MSADCAIVCTLAVRSCKCCVAKRNRSCFCPALSAGHTSFVRVRVCFLLSYELDSTYSYKVFVVLHSNCNTRAGCVCSIERAPERVQYSCLNVCAADQVACAALSVRDLDPSGKLPIVRHYKVRRLDGNRGYFVSPQASFTSFNALIAYYCRTLFENLILILILILVNYLPFDASFFVLTNSSALHYGNRVLTG